MCGNANRRGFGVGLFAALCVLAGIMCAAPGCGGGGSGGGVISKIGAPGTLDGFGAAGGGVASGRASNKLIAAGNNHTCAIMGDSTVRCWGANGSGQLGYTESGSYYYNAGHSSPVQASGVSGATAISAGYNFTCAIISGGQVKCWGSNNYGTLGLGISGGNTAQAVDVPGLTNAVDIYAGYNTVCAALSDGSVKCWGRNDYGQLGNGTTASANSPVKASGISSAIAVAAGEYHSCALLSGGTVKCWGNNGSGQLGNSSGSTSIPVAVDGLTSVVSIAAGNYSTCASLSDGTVKCWGGSFSTSQTIISGVSGATAVFASNGYNFCAAVTGGALKCWGFDNRNGQLGNGKFEISPSKPSQSADVSGAANVVSAAVGYQHSCAYLSIGAVKCWGSNSNGQLGSGPLQWRSTTPVAVAGITGASAVSSGSGHTCAVLSDATVKCWGDNNSYQLADSTVSMSYTPLAISGVSSISHAAAGSFSGYAVNYSGELKWWGSATSYMMQAAQTATDVSGVASVSSRDGNHCVSMSNGTVKCAGNNYYGQLGNGDTTYTSSFASVSGITNALSVSVGNSFACALISGGAVKCWGYNGNGQLGNGGNTNKSTPVSVSGISNAKAIAAGSDHACALLTDNKIKCWGYNGYWKLGSSEMNNWNSTNVPVEVYAISDAVAITAGYSHTCAIVSGGAVKCWGNNEYGQIGDGTGKNSNVPTYVSGITGATSISAGDQHTCAVVSGGVVKCWGDNSKGQSGYSPMGAEATPVSVAF